MLSRRANSRLVRHQCSCRRKAAETAARQHRQARALLVSASHQRHHHEAKKPGQMGQVRSSGTPSTLHCPTPVLPSFPTPPGHIAILHSPCTRHNQPTVTLGGPHVRTASYESLRITRRNLDSGTCPQHNCAVTAHTVRTCASPRSPSDRIDISQDPAKR